MFEQIDLTGRVIGELTVLHYAGWRKWKCRCSCGREVEKFTSSLLRNRTTVCSRTFHARGLHKRHPAEYAAWNYNKRAKQMVEEWAASFAVFLEGVGPKPEVAMTLRRLNPAELLGPGNAEWRSVYVDHRPGDAEGPSAESE